MGTQPDDFEMVAASLRADAGDLPAYVEALAVKLEGALPGRLALEQSAGTISRKLVPGLALPGQPVVR